MTNISKKLIFIFIILIVAQTVYSFLFPIYGPNDCWKPLETLSSYKGYSFDAFDNLLVSKVYSLVSNYRLNCDAGGYILLAHDFPQDYFRSRVIFLVRPLYSFLVNLASAPLHLISNSYSMTFVAGIMLNFVLFLLTVLMLYSLVKNFFSSRIAFWSCVLLIFSPFAHSWLIQPETNVFGAFALILSLYLLYNYIIKSSKTKLVLFSLLIGVLMLGKMFFAISFFILILALYFKRYREGIIFLILHLVPLGLWYLWVTQVWNLSFHIQEVSAFGVGIWLFGVFSRQWYEILGELFSSLPNFITAVIYGFLLIPVMFSLVGFYSWYFKRKNILYFGLSFSFLMLFFISHLYLPRHAFLLFPIIYPTAVLGIDKTSHFLFRHKLCHPWIFYLAIFALIITLSSSNIFKIYNYLGVPYL